MVATDPKLLTPDRADIFESGAVTSSETYGINLPNSRAKSNLKPFTQYFWKVKVWDQDEKQSDWSPTAEFSTGPVAESDWHAQWIGFDKLRDNTKKVGEHILPPPAFMRKSFEVSKGVKRAVLHC